MPPPALTAEQSRARIAELRAKGYEVFVDTLPDGTQVVSTRHPLTGFLIVAAGAALCFALYRK